MSVENKHLAEFAPAGGFLLSAKLIGANFGAARVRILLDRFVGTPAASSSVPSEAAAGSITARP